MKIGRALVAAMLVAGFGRGADGAVLATPPMDVSVAGATTYLASLTTPPMWAAYSRRGAGARNSRRGEPASATKRR